jgi:hypothetical protein
MLAYEALAARAFELPASGDDWAALRVWGDELEARGDPRGVLIALEHARRATPVRCAAILRAQREHELANADALLGPLAPLAQLGRRVLALDWRAGRLYGAALDTVHLPRLAGLTAAQGVEQLLAAPITRELRRLYVRVRRPYAIAAVLDLLCAGPPRPLEELLVVGPWSGGLYASPESRPRALALVPRCPALRLLRGAGEIVPLPLEDSPALGAEPGPAYLRAIADASPETVEGRTLLGRGLLYRGSDVHLPTLERLAVLGERAACFVDTLVMMLTVGALGQRIDIIRCLARLGGHARHALPALTAFVRHTNMFDRQLQTEARRAIELLSVEHPQ